MVVRLRRAALHRLPVRGLQVRRRRRAGRRRRSLLRLLRTVKEPTVNAYLSAANSLRNQQASLRSLDLLGRIEDLLLARAIDKPYETMSVSEIAEALERPPSAIRGALYTDSGSCASNLIQIQWEGNARAHRASRHALVNEIKRLLKEKET